MRSWKTEQRRGVPSWHQPHSSHWIPGPKGPGTLRLSAALSPGQPFTDTSRSSLTADEGWGELLSQEILGRKSGHHDTCSGRLQKPSLPEAVSARPKHTLHRILTACPGRHHKTVLDSPIHPTAPSLVLSALAQAVGRRRTVIHMDIFFLYLTQFWVNLPRGT